MSNKYKYVLIIGGVVIVAMFFVLVVPGPATQPTGTTPPVTVISTSSSASSPSATTTATLIVYDGTKDVIDAEVPVLATSTVFSVLQSATANSGIALAYKDYPGMGYLVTRIGDKINGTGGAYWQYWVDGNYAQEGADNTSVHIGDAIDWKFISSQQ